MMNRKYSSSPSHKSSSILILFLLIAAPHLVRGQGVAVVDASTGDYLRLIDNDVQVSAESQVAVVTTTQTFVSTIDSVVTLNYAFPMPESGSATSLRWKIHGTWYDALFDPTPQDSSITGSGETMDADLIEHLGATPLYFEIEQSLNPDSLLIVELTYVQLLPYEFGDVTFSYPNDYRPIQSETIENQHLQFDLASPRTIMRIDLTSHVGFEVYNDGLAASIEYGTENAAADADYWISYSLSLTELGLFGFSTMLPDSLVGDEGEQGFFAFVVEPDPSVNTETISKVFTLIIDRSGSMSGPKIVQARNAASFVVEHLNVGDRFNIIDFNDEVASFKSAHVPFTPTTREEAFAYIDGLQAGGLTNISETFLLAVTQFANADSTLANMIVFFTDGKATTGIRDTPGILGLVNFLMLHNETDPIIFTFGIGSNVNRQLLSRLATENKGLVEFLGDDELEARITNFYLRIRNPVVLDTQVTFDPPVVTEVYPDPLPGLYKGQQVIVGGRYTGAGPVGITLSGEAFGRPVTFSYNLELSGEQVPRYQFLTKIWAKLKIADLLVDYYLAESTSDDAELLKAEIAEISLAFGVISPFTSFRGSTETGGTGGCVNCDPSVGIEESASNLPDVPQAFSLPGNYPNPFKESTTITLDLSQYYYQTAVIKIYDSLGRLVRVLSVRVNGPGAYSIQWDGRSSAGLPVPAGVYIYTVTLGNTVLADTMTRIR